jgi:hypothetical protein
MNRRELEEYDARQSDHIFVCDITFLDCAESWTGKGATISEAIQTAFSCSDSQNYGCGEYSVEIYQSPK